MPDQEAPKIIVDTDWKSQAQAEKERLAAADKAKAQSRPAPAPGQPGEHEVPVPDFIELVRMLATQALMYLGAFPDPETGRRLVSLELAHFNIDLLSTLEQKTKGNLTDDEQKYITHVLHELRMQAVEIGRAVAKAVEQGKIAPAGAAAGAGPAAAGPALNIRPAPKG
jgi:hypothetical protein